MDFFEEHKALIITVLLFAVMLLAMYNINISNENRRVKETLIELNDLRPEKPEDQEQLQQPEPEEPDPQKPKLKTHQAYNQNQEESSPNFKSRLEEMLQKNSAMQEASSEENERTAHGDLDLKSSRTQEQQEASEGNDASNERSFLKGTERNSSISFSLVGRSAIDIPNPIYTCDTPGKIVVNIEVNADGEVIGSSINGSSSTSTNECLINKALKYARGARFSEFPGKRSQPGTITYYFQD